MPSRIRSYIKLLVAFCLIVSFCLVEGEAQTRRKKRTRRATAPAAPRPVITNPTIAPPDATQDETSTSGDVKIISTADGSAGPNRTHRGHKTEAGKLTRAGRHTTDDHHALDPGEQAE